MGYSCDKNQRKERRKPELKSSACTDVGRKRVYKCELESPVRILFLEFQGMSKLKLVVNQLTQTNKPSYAI